MSKRLLAFLVAALVSFHASEAQAADGGELTTRLTIQNEVAFLRDPAVTYGPDGAQASYIPRLALHLAHGLSHWLEFHVGVAMSAPHHVGASNAIFQGTAGTLHAEYFDLMIPVGLTVRRDRGTTFSWAAEVSAGPAFAHWQELELHLSDGDDRHPIDAAPAWHQQWHLQAALLCQWRPSDHFALSFGPHLIRTSASSLHAGITANAEFIVGAGPSF